MEKFYELRAPENIPERKLAKWSDSVNLEQIICPKTKGHYRSSGKRITELSIILPKNNDDIIWTWYNECLLTDKVVKLLQKNNITGYKLSKVIIDKAKTKEDIKKKLYELAVIGKGGNIHPSSGYKIIKVYPCCGLEDFQHFTNGLIVNEEQWDKSDIFKVEEYPKFIIITEKVKRVLIENNVSGCEIIPVEKLKISSLVQK